MSSLISVDATFTVGVGCDLVGGFYLARGLLTKPVEIAERSATLLGHSPPVMAGLIKAKAEGEFGIAALALGFLLQAGGYLALIGGVHVTTGGIRPVLAAGLALVVVTALVLLAEWFLRWRVRSLTGAVARATHGENPEPEMTPRLMALIGQALGYGDVDPEDPQAVRRYVDRHFGSQ